MITHKGCFYRKTTLSDRMLLYRGRQYRVAAGYHATHRRAEPKLRNGHILFFEHEPGEDVANSHYGRYVWELNHELPPVPEAVVEMAAEFFELDYEEAYEEVNPPKIVDHAGAWESEEFTYEVWHRFRPTGYSTPDGAVVLDWSSADLVGPIHEEEYYRKYGTEVWPYY